MDSKVPQTAVPQALTKQHDKISNLYKSNKDLTPSELDLQDLNRMLIKAPGKFDESLIQATMDHLFKIANDKMESDHDKKVLVGLRAMVRELETSLYRPQPQY